MVASPAFDGPTSYRSTLLAAARNNADRPALVDRQGGLSAVWRWRTAVDEIDRLAAGLETMGLRAGDTVVVAGAATGPVLLAAAAAKAVGAELIQPPSTIAEESARALLRDPAVSVVIGDGPAETSVWRAAAARSRPVGIVTRSDDGRSAGGRVVTLDRLRALASRRGWAEVLPDVPAEAAAPSTVAAGEADLNVLLDIWAETGVTLALGDPRATPGADVARRPARSSAVDAEALPAAAALAVRVAFALSARARTERWRKAFALTAQLIAERNAPGHRAEHPAHASAADPAR